MSWASCTHQLSVDDPVVCGCRETAVEWRGGQSEWVVIPTWALMTSAHCSRLLNGHSRCSVALLFVVLRGSAWLSLAVSALLWEFMPHLEMHECRYDKHDPIRAPWPCWLLQLVWHQPHTEKSPTPQSSHWWVLALSLLYFATVMSYFHWR